MLIFDEMVTGFRVHLEGGQGLYGVTPDLATYGKAIGGGLALAALAGREELMDHLNPPQGQVGLRLHVGHPQRQPLGRGRRNRHSRRPPGAWSF
ncbi:aminotransferase class III-fold pyridoxal phosphate-dependent enzyme [Streptomyces sp. INA 01156]